MAPLPHQADDGTAVRQIFQFECSHRGSSTQNDELTQEPLDDCIEVPALYFGKGTIVVPVHQFPLQVVGLPCNPFNKLQ